MPNKYQGYYPDSRGYFGRFGGRFIPETLVPLVEEVANAYEQARVDPKYIKELEYYCKHYVGRPSPLYQARRLGNYLGGVNLYFKRDELNHTGAHKINHCIGQALLAVRMGKKRVIAETGAGQHGVATATVCALFGLECCIYMGAKDISRQTYNVEKIKFLGAKVIPVVSGKQTLKDTLSEAMRDWISNVEDTYYMLGTVAGPHPYPRMIRDFQSVIGRELKQQAQEQENRLPDSLVACIGGGSNAIGMFYELLDEDVNLVAVEAGGKGLDTDYHAAALNRGSLGVLHGNFSYFLQDDYGNIKDSSSVSAGLDYPGVGPEHAFLKEENRVRYEAVTDKEAVEAFGLCSRLEGIIPALEPSHALAYVIGNAKNFRDQFVVVNLCGRGDKDLNTVINFEL